MLDAHAEIVPLAQPQLDDVGLRYVCDEGPAIRRKRAGKGFVYVDGKGKTIADPVIRSRIKKLAIPPAWTDVWICPSQDGHIQATGRDAKCRKQYRYHAAWAAAPRSGSRRAGQGLTLRSCIRRRSR